MTPARRAGVVIHPGDMGVGDMGVGDMGGVCTARCSRTAEALMADAPVTDFASHVARSRSMQSAMKMGAEA